MSTISRDQAIQYASAAGFNGQALNTIVAIATAESGLRTDAQGHNTGSVDRGVLQINSYWHAEVPDACAYDPACAFRQAYRISNGGTNFTPWTTYTNGAYRAYLSSSTNTIGSSSTIPASSGSWQASLTVMGEKVAIFLLAALLILLGFYVLNAKRVNSLTATGVKTAIKGALA
jgi:Lysozyme like domain